MRLIERVWCVLPARHELEPALSGAVKELTSLASVARVVGSFVVRTGLAEPYAPYTGLALS